MNNEIPEINLTLKSIYVKPDNKTVPITLRGLEYNHGLFNKIKCFYWWLENNENLGFNEWLDKPRKLEYEWQHLEASHLDKTDTEITVLIDEKIQKIISEGGNISEFQKYNYKNENEKK